MKKCSKNINICEFITTPINSCKHYKVLSDKFFGKTGY